MEQSVGIIYRSTQPILSGQPCQIDMATDFDRRTVFLSGLLELTRERLTLYGHNGHDQIWSTPINEIASCSKGWLKKSLIIKRRVNIEQNYATYLAKLQAKPDTLLERAQRYRRSADKKMSKNAKNEQEFKSIQRDAQKMVGRAKSLEAEAQGVRQEIERLQTDAAYAQKVKMKKADIVKEKMVLPPSHSTKRTISDEYQIWEYMIHRRMVGPSSISIYSTPPEAFVEANGDVLGRTPLIIEKPLTEAAALKGRYDILLELSGFKPKRLQLSATPIPGHKNIKVKLTRSDTQNWTKPEISGRKAAALPSNSIDLTDHVLELETAGTDGILALYQNYILVISSDRKRLLLEIYMGNVTGAKLKKKFMRGIRGMTISFQDGRVTGLEYLFVLSGAGSGETKVLQRRCETIADRLNSHALSCNAQNTMAALQPRSGPPRSSSKPEKTFHGRHDRFAKYTTETEDQDKPSQYLSSQDPQEGKKDQSGLIMRKKPDIRWDDVVGLEDAKKALYASVIYPAMRPDLFPTGWPSGMLLYGPPGTGKTMLAAATANMIDGYFFNLPASSITSKWVGESEKNVANIFKTARRYAETKPVILFMDEADFLMGKNEGGQQTGYDTTKNQILMEMDGVHTKGRNPLVFVMAATNKPWNLDLAFLRRFQKRIYVPLPDRDARQAIFEKQIGHLNADASVRVQDLARNSEGYNGSDIRDICQDAHIKTLHELFDSGSGGMPTHDPRPITMEDFSQTLSDRKPSVSPYMHDQYTQWSAMHGA